MKRWIVTAVDTGDTCDGKARVLAVCNTEKEARAFVRNDMEERVDDATDDDGNCTYDVVDFDKMSLSTHDGGNSCEWNVEEIEFDRSVPDGGNGVFGEKRTFADARVTVTEFLDDFYDSSSENYNQSFLGLERRLQEYFGYEHRDTENENVGAAEFEFVVYHEGLECGRYANEDDAKNAVYSYTGEHSVWYEKVQKDGD